MSSFQAYNTDDPNAPANTYPAPGAGATVKIGPILCGVETKVAGSCYCDVAGGTIQVQQSFEDPSVNHWDVLQPATPTSVGAGTPVVLDYDVIAPYLQVIFVNGGTPAAHLRLFVRVFGMNRG